MFEQLPERSPGLPFVVVWILHHRRVRFDWILASLAGDGTPASWPFPLRHWHSVRLRVAAIGLQPGSGLAGVDGSSHRVYPLAHWRNQSIRPLLGIGRLFFGDSRGRREAGNRILHVPCGRLHSIFNWSDHKAAQIRKAADLDPGMMSRLRGLRGESGHDQRERDQPDVQLRGGDQQRESDVDNRRGQREDGDVHLRRAEPADAGAIEFEVGAVGPEPDANGNATVLPGANAMSLSYDIENRMVVASAVYGSAQTLYEYGTGNTRVYQSNWTWTYGSGSTLNSEAVYFHSVAGQKIGVFTLSVGPSSIWFIQQKTEVWCGAKLINGTVADRVGSFRKYYP